MLTEPLPGPSRRALTNLCCPVWCGVSLGVSKGGGLSRRSSRSVTNPALGFWKMGRRPIAKSAKNGARTRQLRLRDKPLIVLGCFCDKRTAYWEPRSGAWRSEGEARAKRRNGTAEAEPSNQPARESQTASSEGARRSDSPRAVRVASRVACAARPLVLRAPPPACGRIKGAPRAARQNERRREEKRATHARHPCSTAAAITTRDARAARAASRACRPSRCTLARARSARSDDQREGGRQGQ